MYDIDLFAGSMLEDQAFYNGAAVGPVFDCIIAKQFERLRKGDRFFFTTKRTIKGESGEADKAEPRFTKSKVNIYITLVVMV